MRVRRKNALVFMKYYQYTITFQEVPDEITLAFEITSCPHRCDGCHSPHLQEDIGQELTPSLFCDILKRYQGLITNVAFMGGEQFAEINDLLNIVQSNKLKTTLYTGSEKVEESTKSLLNYLKTGPYIPAMGGLDRPTTNQRLVNVETGETIPMNKRFI